jgi:hypothetical protein
MHDLDDEAGATKDCVRCGARAFYWRSAVVAADHSSQSRSQGVIHRQPAWTCMNCGYIERRERRDSPRGAG